MKILKIILIIAIFTFVSDRAWAVTNTRTAGGTLWSETAYWDQGHVPADGEDVALGAQVVAIDVTRIPPTGTLGTITASGVGQMTLALNTVGSTQIYATTITGGTIASDGFLKINGSTANTCTINSNIVGGSGSSGYGVNCNTSGPVIISGNITGGSGITAYGVINGNCTLTITGNITGGTGRGAAGVNISGVQTANLTGNLINGSGSVAWSGYPPVWSPATTNYAKWGTYYLAPVLPAGSIKKSVVSGGGAGAVTGTYDGGWFGVTP